MNLDNVKTGVNAVVAATNVVQSFSNFEILIKSGALKYSLFVLACLAIILLLKYVIGQSNLLNSQIANLLIKITVPINIVCVVAGLSCAVLAINRFAYYEPPVVVEQIPVQKVINSLNVGVYKSELALKKTAKVAEQVYEGLSPKAKSLVGFFIIAGFLTFLFRFYIASAGGIGGLKNLLKGLVLGAAGGVLGSVIAGPAGGIIAAATSMSVYSIFINLPWKWIGLAIGLVTIGFACWMFFGPVAAAILKAKSPGILTSISTLFWGPKAVEITIVGVTMSLLTAKIIVTVLGAAGLIIALPGIVDLVTKAATQVSKLWNWLFSSAPPDTAPPAASIVPPNTNRSGLDPSVT